VSTPAKLHGSSVKTASPVKLTGTSVKTAAREVVFGTVFDAMEEVRNTTSQGYARKLVKVRIVHPPEQYTVDVCNMNGGSCVKELVRPICLSFSNHFVDRKLILAKILFAGVGM